MRTAIIGTDRTADILRPRACLPETPDLAVTLDEGVLAMRGLLS
jgi:hypothetical protein